MNPMHTDSDRNTRFHIINEINLLRVSRTDDRIVEAIAQVSYQVSSRDSVETICMLVAEPFEDGTSDVTLRHRLMDRVVEQFNEMLQPARRPGTRASDHG
eukprot:TRINITY_DN63252_c0_g1_i1.p2 TRINITY_DN63252_c0_g1~~TRINITY_DN63252_c0_g1_i1.p2  ORF type:complete len:117 (-),score=21.98 TRINITY_DN63252_c0_g1_i1:61-360(-)